ncbi:MAG TPA: DUF4136 domain-containing protein [Candidatus Acidoferrum sp.]|jgi:hypothetical protein
MGVRQFSILKTGMLAATAVLCGVALAGCDDHVIVDRNPEVRIQRHATWAWRPVEAAPAPAPGPAANAETRDGRRVISRDEITRNDRYNDRNGSVTRDPGADNEFVRGQIRVAVERNLAERGFVQGDPQTADFLVDYHVAVQQHNATVPVAYGGGYPGLVCGPWRCWESWGWGPVGYGYQNIRFREGMIVFDFVQHSSNKVAYRATGYKPIERRTFTQGEVNDLVHHLIKDLKPGK